MTDDPALRRAAVIGLVFTNLAWGWSFPASKWGVAAIGAGAGTSDLAAVAFFIGVRFMLSAALYGLIVARSLRGFTRADWAGGLSVGLCFTVGLFAQVVGLQYTRPSISGFLTSLVVIFVPLTQALVLRRPPAARTWPAAALAFAGVLLLSQDGGGATQPGAPFPYFGEVLTVLSAIAFTGQVLFLDHYGKQANTARLTWIQFAVTGVLGVAILIPTGFEAFARPGVVEALAGDYTIQWTILSCALISSVIAFHMMNTYQPRLPAATAGVLYCLEPVFATGFSILLGAEDLRGSLFTGGALILCGIVLVSRPAPEKRFRGLTEA